MFFYHQLIKNNWISESMTQVFCKKLGRVKIEISNKDKWNFFFIRDTIKEKQNEKGKWCEGWKVGGSRWELSQSKHINRALPVPLSKYKYKIKNIRNTGRQIKLSRNTLLERKKYKSVPSAPECSAPSSDSTQAGSKFRSPLIFDHSLGLRPKRTLNWVSLRISHTILLKWTRLFYILW